MSASWADLTPWFRFVPAGALVAAKRLVRAQDGRDWLAASEPPLCVLFVSHRWETPDHPDPRGQQLAALRRFVDLVVAAVRTCLVAPEERGRHLPALDVEGVLPALAVAFRILDLEPLEPSFMPGPVRRAAVVAAASELGVDGEAFAGWLTARIAVWLDYACVPQAPRSGDDDAVFHETLRRLPDLMAASTLVALRFADDEYAARGWCATESLVASRGPGGRGFARNLFVDIDRIVAGGPLYLPPGVLTTSRPGSEESAVMQEGFELSARAFADARERLIDEPVPYVRGSPPRIWSDYCSLLSDGMHPADVDPRPTRRAMELLIHVGEALVQRWLFAETAVDVDLAALTREALARARLACTAPRDGVYLGLLVASSARPIAFQPMLRAALAAWLARSVDDLPVRLQPLAPSARALLRQAQPATAATWHSRLTSGAHRADERAVVAALERHLEESSLEFAIG